LTNHAQDQGQCRALRLSFRDTSLKPPALLRIFLHQNNNQYHILIKNQFQFY
jgi:hypothetical protein